MGVLGKFTILSSKKLEFCKLSLKQVEYIGNSFINFQHGLIKIPLEFARGMTLLECMDFASDHRESEATYYDEVNRWIMNDGSGDWVGSQCYQDPERMK